MDYKQHTIKLALNPKFKSTIETGLVAWSHDKNSYKFYFELSNTCGEPMILDGAVGRIKLDFLREGKTIIESLGIESENLGLASFAIPDGVLGYEGKVEAHVYLDYESQTHDLGSFSFLMKKSSIDNKLPDLEFYVSEWDEALKKAEELNEQIKDRDLVTRTELAEVEKKKANKESVNKLEQEVSTKAEQETVNKQVSDLEKEVANTSRGMIGDYRSVAELNAAYPNGEKGFSLVDVDTDINGQIMKVPHTFTWNGTLWDDRGPFNAVEILDNSIGFYKLDTELQSSLGKETIVTYISENGGWKNNGDEDNSNYAIASYKRTTISVSPSQTVFMKLDLTSIKRIIVESENGDVLYFSDSTEKNIKIICPSRAKKLKIHYYNAGSIVPTFTTFEYSDILAKDETYQAINAGLDSISDVMYFTLPLINGLEKYPNLEPEKQLLTIPKVTELTWKGGRMPLPNGLVVDLSKNNNGQIITGYVRKVYFNKATLKFEVWGGTDPSNIKDYVIVATIRLSPLNKEQKNLSITMSCHCLVNGEYFSPEQKDELEKIGGSKNGSIQFSEEDNIKVYYHRGYNKNSPENVSYSFKEAKKRGAIWVETDICYTKDNVPVILHDDSINRTARNDDGSKIATELLINDLTLTEVKKYDFGIAWGNQYKGERILTLDEFLNLCYKLSLKARLELKQTPDSQKLNSIKKSLEDSSMLKNVDFCGSYYALNLAKNYFLNSRLVYIVSTVTQTNIDYANELKSETNTVRLGMQVERLDNPNNVKMIKDNGFPLEFWTVDTKDNLEKCLIHYPVAITTNNLDYFNSILN